MPTKTLAPQLPVSSQAAGTVTPQHILLVDSSGNAVVIGGGAAIGQPVPSTAQPVGVKDNAGNLAYPQVDGSGNLLVAVTGAGSGGTSSVDGSTYTAGVTAGTPGMLARDDAATALANGKVGLQRGSGLREAFTQVRDAAGNDRGVNVDASNRLTVAVTNTPTVSGTVGISGTVTVTGSVQDVPGTSGGTSDYHAVAAASNNAATIKAGAGQVYGIHGFNVAAYPVYVKIYNKASNPNPAVDTVIRTIAIQAGVRVDDVIPLGLPLGTGIAVAIVKGIGETDNTSVAAGDCVVDVDFK